MILIKNQKISFNNEYFKKIKKFLLDKKVKFELIDSYPFENANIEKIQQAKVIIVFGGDGTILNTFKHVKNLRETLIVPINFGKLGYITSIPKEASFAVIEKVIELEDNLKNDNLKIDERHLIEVQNKKKKHLVLNELIVTGLKQGKPIRFEVSINGKNLIQFKGDGIIVATPTGSTAYNLSAGGPILAPNIEAFILTPISPHSLNLKPIVMSKFDEIKVIFENEHENQKAIIVDGEKSDEKVDSLVCRISRKKLSFIKPYLENHFETLKHKLFWSKNNY